MGIRARLYTILAGNSTLCGKTRIVEPLAQGPAWRDFAQAFKGVAAGIDRLGPCGRKAAFSRLSAVGGCDAEEVVGLQTGAADERTPPLRNRPQPPCHGSVYLT